MISGPEKRIALWKAIQKSVRAIEKNCKQIDLDCSEKQALLHWAYDSRKI